MPTQNPVSLCEGSLIAATPGYTYQWYFLNNPISGQTSYSLACTQNGIYNCVITAPNGCVTTTPNKIVTVNPKPIISLTNTGLDTLCGNRFDILKTTTSFGKSPLSYLWKVNTFNYGPSNVLDSFNTIITTLNPGANNNFSVIVTDANGCKDTSNTVIIYQSNLPTPYISFNGYVLSANISTSYNQWYLNNTPIAGQNSSILTPTQNGQYTYSYFQNNCDVMSYPYTLIDLGVSITNFNKQITIYPNPSSDFITISNYYNYKFEIFDMFGKNILESNKNEIEISTLTKGIYYLVVKKLTGEIVGANKFVKQ